MKKTQNQKKPDSSNKEELNKKDFKKKLFSLGFDPQHTKWLEQDGCGNPNCPECAPGYETVKEYSIGDLFAPTNSESNVEFFPGSSIEDTKVFVDGVLLKGVTKAALEYSSETGDPVLKLELVGFSVEFDR